MVRVKYRYILAELCSEQYKDNIKLPLKERKLEQAIRNEVESLHGDYGLALIQAGFSIKLYNPATRVFIVRVYRKFHTVLSTSLPFITSIGDLKVCIRTLHLSGTIRSALKYVIKHDKEKLTELVKTFQLSTEVHSELSDFIDKCHTRLEKRRLDVVE